MLLFFDTYITNKPLVKSFVVGNDELRKNTPSYAMPKKIDIAKYSLASYAPYHWQKVIIRYGFDENHTVHEKNDFKNYIKKLFPTAEIITGRGPTLTQKDFNVALQTISALKSSWVFYCPNNDHPLMSPNYKAIQDALALGEIYNKKYEFVSIVYSHFSEFVRAGFNDSAFHQQYALDCKVLEETPNANVFLRENGDNSSVQIVNTKLFKHWFGSKKLGNAPIMRAEDLRQHFLTHNQVMIVPKAPICEHFDGYSHTLGQINEITPDKIPPLFIPMGFFEKKIKIRYGFGSYHKNYTNINPGAQKFIFEDRLTGTDLKRSLSDLPLFWRGRVDRVIINPDVDWNAIGVGIKEQQMMWFSPWHSQVEKPKTRWPWFLKSTKNTNDTDKQRESDLLIGREKLAAIGLKNGNKKHKLHIGCGARVLKGWINIDLFYTHYKNYLQYFKDKHYPQSIRGTKHDFYAFDIANVSLPFPDNSVEVVFHEDFIEHLNQKEQILFLSEMKRILRVNGVHRINTPNLHTSMMQYSDFKIGMAGIYKPEWEKHIHKNVLTPKILEEMALLVGYKKIIFSSRNKSKAKGLPLEYRPDPNDRPEDGNIFADLIK